MTRQSSSTGHRCRQLCTNANFTAFGSRRTELPFLTLPSPPGVHGSQGEGVHSHAPDLPAALKPDHWADTATPTSPASTSRSPNPMQPGRAATRWSAQSAPPPVASSNRSGDRRKSVTSPSCRWSTDDALQSLRRRPHVSVQHDEGPGRWCRPRCQEQSDA